MSVKVYGLRNVSDFNSEGHCVCYPLLTCEALWSGQAAVIKKQTGQISHPPLDVVCLKSSSVCITGFDDEYEPLYIDAIPIHACMHVHMFIYIYIYTFIYIFIIAYYMVTPVLRLA